MTTLLHFDVLRFEPMTWDEWWQRYRGVIRVSLNPDRVKGLPVRMMLCGPQQDLYVPHYGDGRSWRDGSPKRLRPGRKPMLVRVAGVRYRGAILVIDGVNRLLAGPRFVVVDILDVSEKEAVYFTDLLSPFFRKRSWWRRLWEVWHGH